MKNKIYKGVEILSLAAAGMGGSARVRMLAQLEPDAIAPVDAVKLAERLKAAGSASLWFDQKPQSKNDNFNFERIEDVLPTDADYIVVPFRGLSKAFLPDHCLDFSVDGVLEAAVPLVYGQTVYPNHDFGDINNALGSVSNAVWDGDDKAGKGVPGINVQYKIDALMNPRISRLLLMRPPGIHSTSLTLLFEFDFSHPQLVEEGRFWLLLGEEVEGHIVRLIVTEILECWECSLVFMGADRLAKQLPGDDDDDETDYESFSAAELAEKAAGNNPPPNSNEEKTMNIPKEKREALGIGFDGDDVPETEIFKALESQAASRATLKAGLPDDVEELKAQAVAGVTLLDEKRAEVTRKAKLAELGSEEGDLDEVVSAQIASADADGLIKLDAYFGKKVAEKFPQGRSSAEDPASAGAVDPNAAEMAAAAGPDLTGGLFS